ncbi:MAG: hypothetical protein B7Z63_05985 [Ignavibacteriae bacterium 37-53-5]|nr:MAG: hypothetical protein B7Z63_05985 [Ignavibacteriae bacterium 37-53-5]
MSVQEIMSGIELRAVEKTNDYVFAGTNRGIFRAAINGNDWGQMNTGLADTNVHALARINTMLFAGTSNGVFVSTNDGSTWAAANTGLTNKKVYALAVSGNNLFAGTHGGGVFISMNHGSSWRAVNTGLTSMNVNALAVSGTTLLAGTSGTGLWIRPVSEMTPVRESPVQIPATFSLAQNYPNPFNPTTAISYQLSAVSQVTLKVYDVLGREVATLVNEVQQMGTHEVRFDGSRMPSGVYFYRLEAGRFTETKKLILMK